MRQVDWVDRDEYPFTSKYLQLDAGRIHYVDEGHGPTLLMVHGTPTWSFLYRHLIRDLAREYRCVALDHLGFGLSDRPAGWSYRPADHARNLALFIERLGLKDIVLVVHDFGGPIGLSYAVEHPENVSAIVICNTWMWSFKGDPHFERAGRLLSGSLGRLLYTRLNFSLNVMLRTAWGDKATLTRAVFRQYSGAFPHPAERLPLWTLARELIGSSDWYDGLWQRRDRIASKPALILWGLKDPGFRATELRRWQETLTNAQVETFPEIGHFVPEEKRDLGPMISRFLTERAITGDAHQKSAIQNEFAD